VKIQTLPTPSVLLDLDRFTTNCNRMRRKAAAVGVKLRPHLKTLKSVDAARLAVDASGAITVSTLTEAEHFSRHGFDDILCAVCLPPAKTARALAIHRATSGSGLSCLIDSVDAANAIIDILRHLKGNLPLWIEIDCGGRRTGLSADSTELLPLARLLSQSDVIDFRGVLTHAGQSYACTSIAEILEIAETEREQVVMAAERLRADGIACPGVSAGSTPTAVHGTNWNGVTELRPGVYMAGDLFQMHMQSHAREDMALSVLATVISSHADRIVVDAGGLALSKDRSMRDLAGDPGYGEVADVQGEPLGLHIHGVHQEHGEIAIPQGHAVPKVGTPVRVYPNHACMTAAAYTRYFVTRGDEVISEWPRINGWD
jgi:D-serine deaminase-like pyridoxal phosphate-dependent protein